MYLSSFVRCHLPRSWDFWPMRELGQPEINAMKCRFSASKGNTQVVFSFFPWVLSKAMATNGISREDKSLQAPTDSSTCVNVERKLHGARQKKRAKTGTSLNSKSSDHCRNVYRTITENYPNRPRGLGFIYNWLYYLYSKKKAKSNVQYRSLAHIQKGLL